LLVLH